MPNYHDTITLMKPMTLHAIIIGDAKKPLRYVQEAELIAGKGIKGDRYFEQTGTFNHPALDQSVRELSLIDYDTLSKCNNRLGSQLDFLDLRRNLVIKNLDIAYVKKNILHLGQAQMKIQRYAPPCRYLSRILKEDMMNGLKYIGGYRAQILTSGKIKLADILKLT